MGSDESDRPRRPGTVLGGAIMTYVGSAFGVFVGLANVVTSAELAESLRTDPRALVAWGVGIAVASVAASVLAIFALRGSNGARAALTVVGGIYVLWALYSLVRDHNVLGVAAVAWIAAAVALFWVGNAGAWYRAHRPVR
ncbi:MAG: hypothetical protein GEV03_05935 [Streptosporangiales bacterium]|nr:hypothetical protein [Streptosporangiales bacterium]